jgi:hypothetical protein
MSLPLKRKCDSLPEPSGAVVGGSNNLEGGEYMSRGHARGRARGRGRDRGHGRGRSFHIPKNALQTAILTALWKHRTHGTFTPSLQFGPVPPPPPTSDPKVNSGLPLHPRPSLGMITERPQVLHDPTKINQSHKLNDVFNSSDHQNAPSIHQQKVHRLNGPIKQTHQNKRQNQASTWMDQVIPQLLEPFMDILRWTKSGRESVSPPASNDDACSCASAALKITCVSWNC